MERVGQVRWGEMLWVGNVMGKDLLKIPAWKKGLGMSITLKEVKKALPGLGECIKQGVLRA